MSDIDQRLKQAFGEHTEGVRVVADLAERAIARDRSNRRRELGVAALGAGLVLAVAVPVGWGALRPTDVRPLPVGPSVATTAPTAPTGRPSPAPSSSRVTTAPTPTAIPTLRPTGAPDAVRLTPATGPVTAATDVGYVVDGVFHLGATSVALPADLHDTAYVARLGDGLIVSGPDGYVVVGPDGRRGTVIASSQQTPRVSEDLTHVLLSDADGALVYADSRGTRLRTLPPGSATESGYSPAGLVGTTAYAARPGTGASVAWDVVTGRVVPVRGELSLVNATSGVGLAAIGGDVAADGSNFCNALIDLTSGRELWRLCGPLRFVGFSADGTHLLATGHVDGLDPWRFESLVVVRASDGAIVLQGGGLRADAKDDVVSARMGADQRLTLQVWNGETRDLQRCGLDGRCEVVGAARALPNPGVPEASGPYVLSDN